MHDLSILGHLARFVPVSVDTARSGKRELRSHGKGSSQMGPISRREFVRLGTGAVAAGAVAKSIVLEPAVLAAQSAPSDRKIRFVSIGTGIRGCDLLRSARKVQNGICM